MKRPSVPPRPDINRLHKERNDAGLCMYDGRALGRAPHGELFKAGRCQDCYERTKESNNRRYREKRELAKNPPPLPTARVRRLVNRRKAA